MSGKDSGGTGEINVEYVAALARLELTGDESRVFRTQLADIVEYMRKIRELDLSAVEPMAHGVAVWNVLRGDDPEESQPVEMTMANAPASRDDQFLVPKILE